MKNIIYQKHLETLSDIVDRDLIEVTNKKKSYFNRHIKDYDTSEQDKHKPKERNSSNDNNDSSSK